MLRGKKTSKPLMLAYLLVDVTPAKEMALKKKRLRLTPHSIGEVIPLRRDANSVRILINFVAEKKTSPTVVKIRL